MAKPVFEWTKRIQALAETGLAYTDSQYDRDRYEEIQDLCFNVLNFLTDVPIEKIRPVIQENNGYRTPKVDVRAVVFSSEGKLLLVREKVDGCWSLPGGWADVGYTPRQIAEKECFEEAGLTVKALRLLAVMDKTAQQMPPEFEYVYKLFIRCEPVGDRIAVGNETSEVGWFGENEFPELSKPRNTKHQLHMMFQYFRGEKNEVFLD